MLKNLALIISVRFHWNQNPRYEGLIILSDSSFIIENQYSFLWNVLPKVTGKFTRRAQFAKEVSEKLCRWGSLALKWSRIDRLEISKIIRKRRKKAKRDLSSLPRAKRACLLWRRYRLLRRNEERRRENYRKKWRISPQLFLVLKMEQCWTLSANFSYSKKSLSWRTSIATFSF